jgi:polysaccharide biosynthesis/export protein
VARAKILFESVGAAARAALIGGCTSMLIAGCGSINGTADGARASAGASDPPAGAGAVAPTAGGTQITPMAAFSAAGLKDPDDRARLARLWRQRTANGGGADFVLGPGDVIEISVPVIAELKDRTERIAGNGTVLLPFVGSVKAAGLTERELKAAIAQRLSAVMYRPQIDLFVKEYRSRQVAVVGQVDKPGLYDLSSPNDTLLDMLNDAGGINKDAALRVLFIPAQEDSALPGNPRIGGRAAPDAGPGRKLTAVTASTQAAAQLQRRSNPIVIGLGDLSTGGDPAALMLPARPGDMLVVPGAGEVVVEGWVDKPGSYKITPGLTLAGAVGAAGGPLFAAKESAVTIMREGPGGKRIFIDANLALIDDGRAPDLPVQEGDVVSVPYSAMKLMPYAALSLLGKGIYFSAAAPAF